MSGYISDETRCTCQQVHRAGERLDYHVCARTIVHARVCIFNKIAIQGTPKMEVDKAAIAYRESTQIVLF